MKVLSPCDNDRCMVTCHHHILSHLGCADWSCHLCPLGHQQQIPSHYHSLHYCNCYIHWKRAVRYYVKKNARTLALLSSFSLITFCSFSFTTSRSLPSSVHQVCVQTMATARFCSRSLSCVPLCYCVFPEAILSQ